MNSKKHLIILSLILTIISLSIFVYKVQVLDLPLTNKGTSPVWTVDAKLAFEADNRPIRVTASIPPDQSNFERLNENFVSPNYGASITHVGNNRIANLSIRSAQDRQTLYYRAQFYVDADHVGPSLPVIPLKDRPVYDEAKGTAVNALITNVRKTSADSFSFATGILNALQDTRDGNVATLLDRNYSTEHIAKTAVDLLKGPDSEIGPNIIARLVYGFRLTSDVERKHNIPLEIYVAVWDSTQKKWDYINPENDTAGLPHDFLVWQYGDQPLIIADGASEPNISFSFTQKLAKTLDIAQEAALQQRSRLMEFSLFNLPIPTQHIYQILLMIPIGALIILFLRSFVGIETFGTFMPVLIALAFRETQLVFGIFLFVLIIFIGLLVRFYLEHLKLLLIPRLSAVLSSVIIILIALSMMAHQLGSKFGLSIALFPIVILTMTIERMSIVWEERNPWEAIKQSLGSLLAATLCYFAMTIPWLEHLMFVFPELILLVMVLMLWMGRYHGYRLSELFRFKDLGVQ